jgi:hypothetical protein
LVLFLSSFSIRASWNSAFIEWIWKYSFLFYVKE